MKFFTILLTLFAVSCSVKRQEPKVLHTADAKAVSDLHSASMEKMSGMLSIEDAKDHMKINITVSGLKPNAKHGIHIHQNGICEGPYYKSAGIISTLIKNPMGNLIAKKDIWVTWEISKRTRMEQVIRLFCFQKIRWMT